MTRHRLSISDPMFFEGPDGPNKVLADGVGLVKGSPQWQVALESYLLSVLHPFVVEGEEVRQLIVTPRHVGETLDNVMHRDSWVNVARVKPSFTLQAGDVCDGSEFVGWAIAGIHRERA